MSREKPGEIEFTLRGGPYNRYSLNAEQPLQGGPKTEIAFGKPPSGGKLRIKPY